MENIKINFLHICENAFFAEDKKLNIIGIFDHINAKGFPAMHSRFSIALSVTGIIHDKKIIIEIMSPDGIPIISLTLKNVKLGNEPKTNLVLNFIGVKFPQSGNYKIIFKVDDKIISSDRQDMITVKEEV
ncbi:MAG: hypothetical protein AAB972_00065 [Patescibacteria group bacterium]